MVLFPAFGWGKRFLLERASGKRTEVLTRNGKISSSGDPNTPKTDESEYLVVVLLFVLVVVEVMPPDYYCIILV